MVQATLPFLSGQEIPVLTKDYPYAGVGKSADAYRLTAGSGPNTVSPVDEFCDSCRTKLNFNRVYFDSKKLCSRCYQAQINEKKDVTGWLCARCGKSNAPSRPNCDCNPTTITITAQALQTRWLKKTNSRRALSVGLLKFIVIGGKWVAIGRLVAAMRIAHLAHVWKTDSRVRKKLNNSGIPGLA